MTIHADWFQREVISPKISRIREPYVHDFFSANIYHVRGRDADLVVDFGMGLASLTGFLQLMPGKPVIAVATHVHVDHVGSFHEFETRLGHEAEAEGFATMVDEATLANLFRALSVPVMKSPEPLWKPSAYAIRPAPLTHRIAEGEVVDLGDQLYRVLHLPGHSPGSIGLLEEKTGVFFSGDAIYDGGLVDDLPGSNRADYCVTMQRLKDLDTSIVLGGHGDALAPERARWIAKNYLQEQSSRL